MANIIALSILGTPKVTFAAAQTYAVPVNSFIASPVPANLAVPAGTDSLVTVFPTGLNQPARVLYCAETVAQIVTAANAPLA